MSTGKLDGKVALVTGSSRGIGRAIALRLSSDGAKVVVNYAGSVDKANEVVATIEANAGQAIAVQADIGKTADIHRLFDQTIEHFGQVDILVNNAGTTFYKPIAQVTEEEFDKIFAINVKGTFFACQQAAQRMADGGRIINFSTTVTALMLPTYGAYAATKGAVEQITRVLAKELGGVASRLMPFLLDPPIQNYSKQIRLKNRLIVSRRWQSWVVWEKCKTSLMWLLFWQAKTHVGLRLKIFESMVV